MASGGFLSSLSAYSAALTVPITLAAFAFTERGATLFWWTLRKARAIIRPHEGKCESRDWEILNDGPMHVCTSPFSGACHDRQHVQGVRCWETTITTVINNWSVSVSPHVVDKPEALSLGGKYIRTDVTTILAFAFMASDHQKIRPRSGIDLGKSPFKLSGLTLDIQTLKPGLVLLHIDGKLNRIISKEYMECLLQGFPPLLNDPRNSSWFKTDDEARGGWVVALGLDQNYSMRDTFFPIYYDCVHYDGRRGGVFWRSMDRVQRIITDIWAKAFKDHPTASQGIADVIRALDYIHRCRTESGLAQLFVAWWCRDLPTQETRKIIEHFNGPPLIAADEERAFRDEWEPLLEYVLVAAVKGSVRCMKYFKAPGRELNNLLPMDVLKSSQLYLRGC